MVSPTENKNDRVIYDILCKILASPEKIKGVCEQSARRAARWSTPEHRELRTAQWIIHHYSNLTAAGGGASAIPGMIPGIGIVLSLFGAGALDAFLALKFEIEMTLALSHLAGFDITDAREHKIACLMACSALEDAYQEDKVPTIGRVLDLAISEYSTREMSKTLVKAFARAMMLLMAKKWSKFFPIVGIGIEMSVNKVLSAKLGRECWKAIVERRDRESAMVHPDHGDVFEGEIEDD